MKLFKTITYAIFCLVFLYMQSYAHEFIHTLAYDIDGIDSEINYDFGIPSSVIAQTSCESDSCFLINGNNEIINYNLTPLLCMVCVGLGFIIFILDNKEEY